MHAEYDDIAEQYKRSKSVLWRYHIEQYSLFELLRDLHGKSVLDLACGEGHYTRLLKAMGAGRVAGVDLSSKMIELAEVSEQAAPMGIQYTVADAKSIQFPERFDLVTAAYLLNYARTKEDMLAMCQAIARNLKPGGRFVTVNNNPAQHVSTFQITRKYGFVKSVDEEIRNGTPIRYTFFLDGESFEIENFHLDTAIHEWALREAGFSGIRWHPAKLSPAEERGPNREFWEEFFPDPPVVLLECHLPEGR
jgi:ubiquinone/menaquinone biosynthesis C-methylase UbiE